MTEIRPATREDLQAVVSLITRLQADPAYNIGFYGNSEEEVAGELAVVQPDWHEGAILGIGSSGALKSVLSTDVNPEIGRAWLYGPHVDVPSGHPAAPQAWHTAADALLDAALKLPHLAGIEDLNLYGHVEHRQLAEFAERHGFVRETPTRIYILGGAELRSMVAQDVGKVELLPADGSLNEQFTVLLERCFPNRASTAAQLLSGKHTIVVVRQADGKLAGFAAGYPSEVEYMVEYVAVEPDMRCVGVGGQVVRGLIAALDAKGGAKREATAVVRVDNHASSAMFTRLGFQIHSELVSYNRRKP